MNWKVDTPFDLEKIRLEELSKMITRALTHFEDNPRVCWAQVPMEKPLWEVLDECVDKRMSKKVKSIKTNIDECPNCGLTFYFYSEDYPPDDTNYCRWCGQKLDWD